MRVAKPSKEMIQASHDFIHACEHMLERQKYSVRDAYEEWKEWDNDDEEKILLLKIRSRLAEEEGVSEDRVDGRIVAYEYLQDKYTNRLQHVVMSVDIMIDNVCDPTGDCLDFHPGFQFNEVMPEQ